MVRRAEQSLLVDGKNIDSFSSSPSGVRRFQQETSSLSGSRITATHYDKHECVAFSFDDGFPITNEYGAIRRQPVYNKYLDGEISENDVMDIYCAWRDDPEYFILRGIEEQIQTSLFGSDRITYSNYIYKFVKASKRGNDVYRYLVSKKLKTLGDLPGITFFQDNGRSKNTRLLFVTLTYNTNRCNVRSAWENIGKDLHLLESNLRKKYGDIKIFRTWESTGNFYPHVHLLIYFIDKSFPVFIHTGKDGKRSFRISKKNKDWISSFWHSNVDIQAVGSTNGAVKELTKYITKDLCSNKGNKTNAMIWLFRKQSYAISKGFVRAIAGKDINVPEPKATDLITDVMCNCNQGVKKWEFLGILRGKHLGFSPDLWCVDVKKPPPKIQNMLIYEHKRWNALHRRKY